MLSSTSFSSDSKHGEPQLELSRVRAEARKFRILSELSNDCCFEAHVVEERAQLRWLSDAVEYVSGYAADELGERGLWSLISPRDRAAVERVHARALSGEPQVHEYRVTTKSGGERWLREQLRCDTDEHGVRVIYGSVRDVSEQHASDREHEQLAAQLHQAQKLDAVGRLAGGIAHDFNNLLTVITTHCGFLLSELPARTQPHDDAGHIQTAARRAAELTQRLLAFSRQQVLTPTVLDLNVVLRELEPALCALIGERVELELEVHHAPLQLSIDRSQLEQILLNLVVNARDAMPRGGKLQVTTASARLDAAYVRNHPGASEGAHVALRVCDTGSGMGDDVLGRIFEPFFTTKEHGRGAGLGLSTVYGIVKQSGGSIHVVSEVGLGTCFEVFLRAASASERNMPSQPPPSPATNDATILVVEDEDGVRRSVQRILKHAGYRVLVAADPEQALTLASKHAGSLDLLLTDVMMPTLTGPELAERVLRVRPDLKVIYMSGHAREALDGALLRDQGAEFVQKPFTRQSLLAKIEALLGGAPTFDRA